MTENPFESPNTPAASGSRRRRRFYARGPQQRRRRQQAGWVFVSSFVGMTLLVLAEVFVVGEKELERRIAASGAMIGLSPAASFWTWAVVVGAFLFVLWAGGMTLLVSSNPPRQQARRRLLARRPAQADANRQTKFQELAP